MPPDDTRRRLARRLSADRSPMRSTAMSTAEEASPLISSRVAEPKRGPRTVTWHRLSTPPLGPLTSSSRTRTAGPRRRTGSGDRRAAGRERAEEPRNRTQSMSSFLLARRHRTLPLLSSPSLRDQTKNDGQRPHDNIRQSQHHHRSLCVARERLAPRASPHPLSAQSLARGSSGREVFTKGGQGTPTWPGRADAENPRSARSRRPERPPAAARDADAYQLVARLPAALLSGRAAAARHERLLADGAHTLDIGLGGGAGSGGVNHHSGRRGSASSARGIS